jgi:hypothetical protein
MQGTRARRHKGVVMSKMSELDLRLREIVFSNLTNASEAGQFEPDGYLYDATAQEIADDMIFHAADCEDYTADMLLPYVREWMDAQ